MCTVSLWQVCNSLDNTHQAHMTPGGMLPHKSGHFVDLAIVVAKGNEFAFLELVNLVFGAAFCKILLVIIEICSWIYFWWKWHNNQYWDFTSEFPNIQSLKISRKNSKWSGKKKRISTSKLEWCKTRSTACKKHHHQKSCFLWGRWEISYTDRWRGDTSGGGGLHRKQLG